MSNKVLCFCVTLSFCIVAIKTQKVSVTVYYESACPDSKQFFNNQLYPVLTSNLGNYVDLTLVPYGKSNETIHDGEPQFSCHHGPYECVGNKIHACAINKIMPDSNKKDGFNNMTVGTINCLMKTVTERKQGDIKVYNFTLEYCAKIHNVQNYQSDIQNCSDNAEGDNFLSYYGNLSRQFKSPSLTSVPTITINTMDESTKAQTNFKETLCSYIPNKPKECGASSLIVSTFALAMILLRQLF